MSRGVPQRRSPHAPSHTARKLMALVLLLTQIAPPGSRAASLSTTGRWSSSDHLDVIGTHVVLLREPQSNAAKVFLFGESGTNQNMKLWRFFASADSARLPDTLNGLPASQLRHVPHPDALANDLFCNGHSVLPDGRMLFIGGNYQPQNACETVYTFDPGWFGGATSLPAQAAPLAGAVSSAAGDVFDVATGTVDTALAMVAGDTLSLLFADLPAGESGTRTWLLEVVATPVAPSLAQALANRRQPEALAYVPTAFTLHPAAPNPTRGTVRLAFDLPVRTGARLEIFDAQGRRVRRLEGTYEAGRQAFDWDLRHGGGARVAPGIYSYRLTAGTFRAQRKLVVLP